MQATHFMDCLPRLGNGLAINLKPVPCSKRALGGRGLILLACATLLAGWEPGFVPTSRGAAIIADTVSGGNVRRVSFAPPEEMQRADFCALTEVAAPEAVLILCPGCNGNGEELIRQPSWQDFARRHHLALCAISFASPVELLQTWRGYYCVSRGSGEILLEGVRRSFGRDLPILVYGFSGGAHFTASLVNWKPARVLAWCAYSAAWWEEPAAHPEAFPPGIVACGDADTGRYGASLTFFAKGRALGRPWTWISLGGVGHAGHAPLDRFVRAYFTAALDAAGKSKLSSPPTSGGTSAQAAGSWYDVDTKLPLSPAEAAAQPTLACWLPTQSLGNLWTHLHQP